MSGSTHTRCRKGQRVLCVLKDGMRIVGHFHSYKHNVIYLYSHHTDEKVKIATADLRAMVIVRNEQQLQGALYVE